MRNMNELIKQIEDVVSELIRYNMDIFAAKAQDMVDKMVAVFPVIISSYSDPQMEDVREDALYWPKQLERIINALESPDRFETVDVLYNETYPNLIELRDILIERGVMNV